MPIHYWWPYLLAIVWWLSVGWHRLWAWLTLTMIWHCTDMTCVSSNLVSVTNVCVLKLFLLTYLKYFWYDYWLSQCCTGMILSLLCNGFRDVTRIDFIMMLHRYDCNYIDTTVTALFRHDHGLILIFFGLLTSNQNNRSVWSRRLASRSSPTNMAASRPDEWRHCDVILLKSSAAILTAAMFVGDRTTASASLAGMATVCMTVSWCSVVVIILYSADCNWLCHNVVQVW